MRLSVILLASLLARGANLAVESEDAKLEIINKFLDATKTQQERLRGVQMEVDIDAKLPKLEKQGKLRALRSISKLGQITYKALGFSGDTTIKKEVITRWLEAESQARDAGPIAISPENYKFKLKGMLERDGQRVAILQVSPRRKAIGLFKGELWLDTVTGMPVRESGRLVKNPSVFLKKVEFIRDYEIQDGVAIPTHIESTIDTRLVGRAEITINFSHFAKQEAEDDVMACFRNQ